MNRKGKEGMKQEKAGSRARGESGPYTTALARAIWTWLSRKKQTRKREKRDAKTPSVRDIVAKRPEKNEKKNLKERAEYHVQNIRTSDKVSAALHNYRSPSLETKKGFQRQKGTKPARTSKPAKKTSRKAAAQK